MEGRTSIGPALTYGKLLWENGSKNKVNILLGGYEDFSGHYPFLRTQKVMFTPREVDALQLYPYEVVPGTLYLSKRQMATQGYVRKELKITALINCTEEALTDILSCQVLNVPEADNETADLYQYFETCCNFIDHNHSVLVFSDLGISRSATILIAYIMYTNKYSLEVAYKHMKSCCQFIRPFRNFFFQLSKWEQMIFNGDIITNVEDPNF